MDDLKLAVVSQVTPLLVKFPGDSTGVSVPRKDSGLTFTLGDVVALARFGTTWAVLAKLVAT